ncbi:MAG: hypothetical protein HY257_00440 [Chloroflexi bacterium]|nr:hypothetical protein [Chloroflexota bacterium]
MHVLHIEPKQNLQLIELVKSAIQSEIARLQLALDLARKRLAPFESKYKISSEEFIRTQTAEDLQGGDDEYVQWAGEFKLTQRLEEKLNQLKDLRFEY